MGSYYLPQGFLTLHGKVMKENNAGGDDVIGDYNREWIKCSDINEKSKVSTFPGENDGDSVTITLQLDKIEWPDSSQ